MKPMTDLCWVCQQNSSAIMRAANTAEEEKSKVKRIVHMIKKIHDDNPLDCEAGRESPSIGD